MLDEGQKKELVSNLVRDIWLIEVDTSKGRDFMSLLFFSEESAQKRLKLMSRVWSSDIAFRIVSFQNKVEQASFFVKGKLKS